MGQRKRERNKRTVRGLSGVLGVLLCAGAVSLFCPSVALAEDFVIDSPFKNYIEGSIYGSLYIQHKEKEIPVYPPEGNGAGGGTGQQTAASQSGLVYELGEGSGYLRDAATGTLMYRIHPEGDAVTVYGEAFRQALIREEGLSLLIYDQEGILRYRLRYRLEDLQAYEKKQKERGQEWFFPMEEIRFYDTCSHEKQLKTLLGDTEAAVLFLCGNEDPQIPVYIGVRAPEKWEKEAEIRRYDYQEEGAELVLEGENLQMDEERMIESRVEKMGDLVYTKEAIQEQKLNARSFAAGMSGKNSRVNRWYVAGAAVLVLAGGGILIRVFRGRRQ